MPTKAYSAAVAILGDILDDLQYVLNKMENRTDLEPVIAFQISQIYSEVEKLTAAM